MNPQNLDALDRPSVFVASSTEGRPYAKAVKEHLRPYADVDVWDEDIFRLNRAYLDTLLDNAGFYDYGIAVMTPDDEVSIRGEAGIAARDNVVFEYGLFLGRLGPARAFALKEASVRVFSDFSGIEIATFVEGPDPLEATREGCRRILHFMAENEENYEVGFLPSSTLALGYYYNFLGRVIDALLEGKALSVVDKDNPGGERRIAYDGRAIDITILMPKRLRDLDALRLKAKARKLRKISLETTFRPFPFYIEGDLDTDPIAFFDIPTTLYTSQHAMEKIFSREFLRKSANRRRIERREISNFKKTLLLVMGHNEGEDIIRMNDLTVRFSSLDAYDG